MFARKDMQVAVVTSLMRISPNASAFRRNVSKTFSAGPEQTKMGSMKETED
jgi:hypothetical protein